MNARDKRLEKAQMKVLFQVPFFAPGVAKLPIVWDESIDTACTAGENIRWNPKFFDKLKDQEIVTVLAHEVCHCLLGHIWRIPGGGNWDVWNQATDHAVNNMLVEFGAQVKAKNLADPFPFPDGNWCMDPAFKNLSEEEIYVRLNHGGGGGGAGGGNGAGNGKPSIGQIAPGKGNSQAKAKQIKTEWDNTLIQSINAAKGRGTVPGCMSDYLEELLNPTVPWYELLRQFLREQLNDDWNWMKPNALFDEGDFLMPSIESDGMGDVVFATDTSGSIDHELAKRFASEKQNCLDDMKPRKLTDIYCDTRIQRVDHYAAGDTISRNIPGGGGTSFVPVFEHLEAAGITPKCLVYLTDLDGEFPDKDPGYPVLWVAYGGGSKAPFGEVIQAS